MAIDRPMHDEVRQPPASKTSRRSYPRPFASHSHQQSAALAGGGKQNMTLVLQPNSNSADGICCLLAASTVRSSFSPDMLRNHEVANSIFRWQVSFASAEFEGSRRSKRVQASELRLFGRMAHGLRGRLGIEIPLPTAELAVHEVPLRDPMSELLSHAVGRKEGGRRRSQALDGHLRLVAL